MTAAATYSVITACWNSARTLSRCVDSVLAQTVPPSQFIFVDGGSSDGTQGMIRRALAESSSAIAWKLLDQGETRGISAAWNLALTHCTADVVFILNSDDWYEKQCAEQVLAAMRDDAEAEIVLASSRVYRNGESVPSGVWRNRPGWLMPVLMPYVHPACFVRRSVYARIGSFDTQWKYAMDYDLLWRCRAAKVKLKVIPDVLLNFELGGAADSHRKEARLEVYRIARRYCRIAPVAALAARYVMGR